MAIIKKARYKCAWWYTLVIPGVGRYRQENHGFEANLGCIMSSRPTWTIEQDLVSKINI
jgi:hypothetical protein